MDIVVSLHSSLLTSLEFKTYFFEVFRQLSSKVFYVKVQLGPHALHGMGLTFLNAPISTNPLELNSLTCFIFIEIVYSIIDLCAHTYILFSLIMIDLSHVGDFVLQLEKNERLN